VTIDDKHIEIIVNQNASERAGRGLGRHGAAPGTVIDKFKFKRVNQETVKQGKKPARAEPLLLGITKASLHSESFISAASFQETTKVLTEAALAGRTDLLLGLKENVILGHLVPAGTGFKAYHDTAVKKLGEPIPEEPLVQLGLGGSDVAKELMEAALDAPEELLSLPDSEDDKDDKE